MSDTIGIETRSRSRSKTPGLLANENGDSSDKKGAKKIPTVSLIEEEEVIEISSQSSQPSQPSQRPKRQRRSAKNAQSDTSGDGAVEVVSSNNKQSKVSTSTTTTVVTTKQIINGSEEKTSEETATNKMTTLSTSNNDAPEISESQNIFNNIFNAIKTSTPILSTKRTKRVALDAQQTSLEIDYNVHPAYKEYKEAGEYWNKFPKTDYTYSELSPHRRELGAGIVAMPNMSRKSLDKYTNRVEAMIQKNPTEESFIRRKFLSNMSYQQKATDLQYDSADEVDVSILHKKMAARRYSQKNIFYRFFVFIISAFSSAYSTLKQKIWYNSSQHHLSYTPIKRQNQQGFLRRIYNSAQKFVLLCISKVYLFISTILCLDTWLLYTRSENVQENRKRKRFLIGLLILFPLMLFGAFLLSDDTSASRLFSKLNNYPLEQFNHRLDHITQYFSNISPPSLPQFNFNFGWLISPLLSFGAIIREHFVASKQPPVKEQLKKINLMDEDRLQMLLKHINDYVDSTIDQKLTVNNEALMAKVNDRFVLIISNHIRDALKQYEYRLTAKDVEEIVYQIRVQLKNDFDETEKLILSKVSLNNEENIERIKSIASASINFEQLKDVQLENQNLDINKIIMMIFESNKFSSFFDDHLKAINYRIDVQNSDLSDLKMNIDKIKLEIVEKFSNYDEELYRLKTDKKSISDDLIEFKRQNDEAIKNMLMKIDEKFTAFSDYSSIDLSVRKSLLSILGFSNPEFSDEAMLKQWIDNTFVAKGYLEKHLKNLELRLNEAFQLQLDKNAGILMEQVNEKLTSQIKLSVQKLNMESSEGARKLNVKGLLNEADVIKIVKEVLAIYDADKTGLVDYALESAGGEVISTRCTENYRTRSAEISIFGIPIWYPNNTPRTVISPTINPGECWAFQGFPGFLVIKLNNLIHVTGFTVEHIPQANAPNNIIDSAPNNFTVWGLTSEFDKDPVLFGSYFYSAQKNAPSLQYFPVQNKEINQPYQFVELVIESNHGNPKYTCLYRFRVHGEMK